jgi:hypothetical protein
MAGVKFIEEYGGGPGSVQKQSRLFVRHVHLNDVRTGHRMHRLHWLGLWSRVKRSECRRCRNVNVQVALNESQGPSGTIWRQC